MKNGPQNGFCHSLLICRYVSFSLPGRQIVQVHVFKVATKYALFLATKGTGFNRVLFNSNISHLVLKISALTSFRSVDDIHIMNLKNVNFCHLSLQASLTSTRFCHLLFDGVPW